MRIVLITQNEPFYLAKNLKYLHSILPKHSKIISAIISNPNVYGRKEFFIKKALRTFNIFGLKFFLYYSFLFIRNKLNKKYDVIETLKELKIKQISLKNSINNKISLDIIRAEKPDIIISILGNEIFKKDLIELAPKGILNLHSSLLPKYRGLMPTFWVLRNNEKYTGVSLFFVNKGIDTGPILLQKKVFIGKKTHRQLIMDTKKIGMELIAQSVSLIQNNNFKLIENEDEDMSYYSIPTKMDTKEFLTLGKKFF